MYVQLYLSRRNLMTLLNKLNAAKHGDLTHRTIIKCDTDHPKFPILGANRVMVTALEDEEYYTDREPGEIKDFPDVA